MLTGVPHKHLVIDVHVRQICNSVCGHLSNAHAKLVTCCWVFFRKKQAAVQPWNCRHRVYTLNITLATSHWKLHVKNYTVHAIYCTPVCNHLVTECLEKPISAISIFLVTLFSISTCSVALLSSCQVTFWWWSAEDSKQYSVVCWQ